MTTLKRYLELANEQPSLEGCFFAFNERQLKEGMAKIGVSSTSEIQSAGHGTYGTPEGLKKLYEEMNARDKKITEECNPQDIYKYEFDNHECKISLDDTPVIELLLNYFTPEQLKGLKRKIPIHFREDIETIAEKLN